MHQVHAKGATRRGGVRASVTAGLLLVGGLFGVQACAADAVRAPVAWATTANDIGAVPDTTPMHLTLLLARSPERQRAFDAFVRAQQDPASADFHHWLTPEQVGARFGASDAAIGAATSWLRAQGLVVGTPSKSRSRLSFAGNAAAVGRAFATPIHRFVVAGETHLAATQAPLLPAPIAQSVRGIEGLATLREHAAHGSGSAMASTHRAASPAPGGTFCTMDACAQYLFPADVARIYDIDALYAQGIDGSGETIAVVGRARAYLPDIENFQRLSGLTVKDPAIIVPPDGIDPGPALGTGGDPGEDQLEATIDVTRATSVAPGANIQLVVSADGSGLNGLHVASEYVIEASPVVAHVLNISFGACEQMGGQVGVQYYDDLFQQAAAEGISVFVISGDSGAAGCDPYNASPPAAQIASPNFICASSYATCVGGTQFVEGANASTYWSNQNASGYGSATGYIPEGAWNEPQGAQVGTYQASATGGGVSSYLPTPWWQTAAGVPGTAGRYTPDVSFSASAHDGYFACVAAAGNDCVADSQGSFRFEYVFGTSASTPVMAGVAALLNQAMQAPQGNLNQRLYALAGGAGNGVFHDITVGSSGVSACDTGTPSPCNNSTPSAGALTGGLAGYALTPGYDLATGLGSIDVGNLVSHWAASAGAVNLNQTGLTGAWYNPQTSGQGLLIETFPDMYAPGHGLLFGGWFTFATLATSGQRWYSIQGDIDSTSTQATLPVYATYGGTFDAPPKINAVQIGTVVLSFSDCTHGTMRYHLTQDDGTVMDGTVPLTRLSSNVTCTDAGTLPPARDETDLSGAWYEAATSGQGFMFTVDAASNTLFAAWYTFSQDGHLVGGGASQRWYTLQAGSFPTGTRSASNVPIYAPRNGVFDNPAPIDNPQVGTANVTFTDCTHMTLDYTFTSGDNAGASGSIPMTLTPSSTTACGL